MKHSMTIAAAFVGLAALAGCADMEDDGGGAMSGASTATSPESDLTYLEGARAGQAEFNITNQGYTVARQDGLTTWWLNAETQTCAQITTADGRYASVQMINPLDC
jgi:hypothetical protein